MDLIKLLPKLVDLGSEWAEQQSSYVLKNGVGLGPRDLNIASKVGVRHPEAIRILAVSSMPKPDDPILAAATEQLQFLSPGTEGFTLGYAIFIRKDRTGDRSLIAHECRHVYQYEQHGSMKSFVKVYITDLLEFGYEDSPLEVDARRAAAECIFGCKSNR